MTKYIAPLPARFGVPFFLHGREAFWDAERVSAFVSSVRGVARDGESDAPLHPARRQHNGLIGPTEEPEQPE
ncbi:hypothetical protein ACIQRW_23500 [Streptomyces sp. NPDC091287]|uniref:hypothetical protein n=1 Tax=Streptomyces sp. NPDC091287 TaxID=3365988 RepID=UPI0038051165